MSDRYIGLMSGTSLDGVDAVLVEFGGESPQVHASCHLPFSAQIREAALSLQRAGHDELHGAAILGNQLAAIYAEAVQRVIELAGTAGDQIAAIGCHGQTLRHRPQDGYTLQIGNPALLVELTGITVVADFRSRDIAAGGQGAPLVPVVHDALFRRTDRHRVILNLGGIANVTDLAPGKPTTGFDCGPANMLLDAWAEKHLSVPYDHGGEWALTGNVVPELLDRLLTNPYFQVAPPKSCGREEFGIDWLLPQLAGNEKPEDIQATLVALTAHTVANAVRRWCGLPQEMFTCGGGVHNKTLIDALRRALAPVALDTTAQLGIPPHLVEAVAFAWLARRCLQRMPGNLPPVTGAKGSRVLGSIYSA